MSPLDNELFWAVIWALVHVCGVIATLVLRQRSARQLGVAEAWRAHAAPDDRQEADDLVLLTGDRHRRNGALVVVVVGYLLLGLLVLSQTISPWLDDVTYRVVSRLDLTTGEAVLIGSAWASVLVGDRIARKTTRRAP
jgi:hypothetical protein